jgi:hypothetical protein
VAVITLLLFSAAAYWGVAWFVAADVAMYDGVKMVPRRSVCETSDKNNT